MGRLKGCRRPGDQDAYSMASWQRPGSVKGLLMELSPASSHYTNQLYQLFVFYKPSSANKDSRVSADINGLAYLTRHHSCNRSPVATVSVAPLAATSAVLSAAPSVALSAPVALPLGSGMRTFTIARWWAFASPQFTKIICSLV